MLCLLIMLLVKMIRVINLEPDYLQWTTIGPFTMATVEFTLCRKCTNAEANLGTPLSGQAVK